MQPLTDNIPLLVVLAMTGTALLVICFILLNIRQQNRLLLQKRRLQEAEIRYQKELLHAVIASQEQERRRIGMDLHDEVGSALSSLRMILGNWSGPGDAAATAGLQQQCKKIIDRVITDVRNISHNLSPLTRGVYGFSDAIEDLCDGVNQSGQLQVALQLDANGALNRLDDTAALALYRVVAELINNTIKHAGAREISLSFFIDNEQLAIDYADDGKGLPPAPDGRAGGMGMRNIESRLGMIGAAYRLQDQGPGFGLQIRINTNQPSKSTV
ncbi:MAG: histidine kinase [Chitinophagaceae bacterium]